MRIKAFCRQFAAQNFRKPPSDLWNQQRDHIQKALGDIISSDDDLQRYYCAVTPRKYDSAFVPSILLDIPPSAFLEEEARRSENTNLATHLNPKEWAQHRPILILSPIGRGKTTFINYAARIQFPKELNITNIKFIIVDVKNWFVTDPNKFHPQLLKSLDSWIKETYPEFIPNEATLDDFFSLQCDLYKAELLERGLPTAFARENISMKEKQIAVFNSHRDDLLDYIARRITNINTRKGIYHLLVIDNLDQHIPYLQQVGFIDSVATATHMKVPVLFTLRDTSFEHEAAHQALSAYTFDYLNLSMPSIKEVVSKRIDTLRETWAKHIDSSENVRFVVDGKEHDVKKRDAYIKGLAVLDLLAGKEVSDWVNDILTKTSNQSVRELLRIVRLILSSYHTFAPLSSREEFDPSVHSTAISLPRIMLALILGNNPFYQDDSDTPVVNLFENRSDGHNNFFLRVRILQYLSSKGSGATLGDVLKTMETAFQAGEGPCIFAIEKLLKKRLLNLRPSDLARTEGLDLQKHGARRIFITPLGQFHIEELLHNDRYLDEVKFATYLPQDAYDRVFFRGFADSMDERLHSTSFFLEFLKKQELENQNMVVGNDSADLFPPIMEDVMKTYLKRMNNLLKKDDYQDND